MGKIYCIKSVNDIYLKIPSISVALIEPELSASYILNAHYYCKNYVLKSALFPVSYSFFLFNQKGVSLLGPGEYHCTAGLQFDLLGFSSSFKIQVQHILFNQKGVSLLGPGEYHCIAGLQFDLLGFSSSFKIQVQHIFLFGTRHTTPYDECSLVYPSRSRIQTHDIKILWLCGK